MKTFTKSVDLSAAVVSRGFGTLYPNGDFCAGVEDQEGEVVGCTVWEFKDKDVDLIPGWLVQAAREVGDCGFVLGTHWYAIPS